MSSFHAAGAGKFELTKQDSAGGNFNVLQLTRKALKSGYISHWRCHQFSTKRDLQFQKLYQYTKVKNMKGFCLRATNLGPKMGRRHLEWHLARSSSSVAS